MIEWRVTFDAKREPMFQAADGSGWVPLARFYEVEAERDQLLAQVRADHAYTASVAGRPCACEWCEPA